MVRALRRLALAFALGGALASARLPEASAAAFPRPPAVEYDLTLDAHAAAGTPASSPETDPVRAPPSKESEPRSGRAVAVAATSALSRGGAQPRTHARCGRALMGSHGFLWSSMDS